MMSRISHDPRDWSTFGRVCDGRSNVMASILHLHPGPDNGGKHLTMDHEIEQRNVWTLNFQCEFFTFRNSTLPLMID